MTNKGGINDLPLWAPQSKLSLWFGCAIVTGGEQVIVSIDQRVKESIKSECRDVISWIVLFNIIRNDAELC